MTRQPAAQVGRSKFSRCGLFSKTMQAFLFFLLASVMHSNAFMTRMMAKVNAKGISMAAETTPGVIIGGGRIGDLMYVSNGERDVYLNKRGMDIPNTPGPIYICTRNNDLDEIIEKTPKNKLEDLVFLQNGMLESYLDGKGLGDNTQALVYFAVAKKGDKPIDGKTEVNPEGQSNLPITKQSLFPLIVT